MLRLNVGDRTVYVDMFGRHIHGTVVRVQEWTSKNGFTYYVRHDKDTHGTGEFRSDDKFLFKEGDTIPQKILDACMTDYESSECSDDDSQ